VAELSQAAQVGLLRALEEGTIRRVGGEKTIAVDVRFIAATNRDLQDEVEAESFREDLFWRLNVVSIHLPPLRERSGDVAALADHFITRHSDRMGVQPRHLDAEALSYLIAYDWPGNVRELENAVESGLVLATGPVIAVSDLPARVRYSSAGDAAHQSDSTVEPRHTLAEAVERTRIAVEQRMITGALKEADGNRTHAAERLGISRKTLFNKMKELGIEPISTIDRRRS